MILALYAATVLIWGSTWIAITYQLNGTAEEVSIALRFTLAAVVLFGIAILRRRPLTLPRSAIPMVVLQGSLMFCANYLLVYHGTNFISSGLMAVIFTLLIPANLLNEFMFFGRRISLRVVLAGVLGVFGVSLLFWPELSRTQISSQTLLGIALGASAVYCASLGNMAAIVNIERKLPVTAVNAWGMLVGGMMSLALAAGLGRPMSIHWDAGYAWSMLYLSVFGSAVAFTCYLLLIERIGSARAAYSSVLLPIVALIISTFMEGFQWTLMALVGLAIALAGNALALTRKSAKSSVAPAGAASLPRSAER